MADNLMPALHAGTPVISAGSRVLHLLLAPGKENEPPRILTTRTVVDPLSRTTRAFGARRLDNTATGHAGAVTVTALADQPLLLHTADGDITLSFSDAAGRPLWSRNAQETVSTVEYHDASTAGRPLSLAERPAGGPGRVREQFSYAPLSEPQWKGINLAGALTAHRHNAGLNRPLSLSLTAQPLMAEERLLIPDAGLPDWPASDGALETQSLCVTATYDATGTPLTQTNAAGVTITTHYDISGAVSESGLSYREQGEDKTLRTLHSIVRRADGVALSQTYGNGIEERYTHDPRSQYLSRHTTQRPAGHDLGALLVSDLHYRHDPAGNLLTLEDKGADPDWHGNRKSDGLRAYEYDTLYRLVSATGRERHLVNPDDLTAGYVWSPYTERYTYDDGDNLALISHNGGSGSRHREMMVASNSNRAVMKGSGNLPEEGFLAGGLQKQLADGRVLDWYADSQLQQVTPVTREPGKENDIEHYHYANGGSRTRKIRRAQVSGGTQQTVTTYAGGCETRQRSLGDRLQQDRVITEAGAVRLTQNRASGEVHLRYGFSDHLNSSSGESDSTGRVSSREEYAPYGGTVGSDEDAVEVSNLMQRTYRYSGKERDATGLYYYGWRYYQPESGRWLSSDPGGLIDGINLFRFCRDNPVVFSDENGMAPGDNPIEITDEKKESLVRVAFEMMNKRLQPSEIINFLLGEGLSDRQMRKIFNEAGRLNKSASSSVQQATASMSGLAISAPMNSDQGEGILLFYASNAGAKFINSHSYNAGFGSPRAIPALDISTIKEAKLGLAKANGGATVVLTPQRNAAFEQGIKYLKNLEGDSSKIQQAMSDALKTSGKGKSKEQTLYRGTRMTASMIDETKNRLENGQFYFSPRFLSATPDKKTAMAFLEHHDANFIAATEPVFMTLNYPGAIESIHITEVEHIIPPGKQQKKLGSSFYEKKGGVHYFTLIGK